MGLSRALVCAGAFVASSSLHIQEIKEKETVCISLAAYEEPAFIDALLANIDTFFESRTKVALHLNLATSYSNEDMDRWDVQKRALHVRRSGYNLSRWESDRVAVTTSMPPESPPDGKIGVRNLITPSVTEDRVGVRAFMGSVMTSHIMNAKTLEERWPGTCKYFIMQASNMMWVRKGAEEKVRKYRYSGIVGSNHPHAETWRHPFTAELAGQDKVYGWEQPEGAFFPMKQVIGFYTMLDKHMAAHATNFHELADFRAYFEASWLPTYMLHYAEDYRPEDEHVPPLCYRICHAGVASENDGMTMEELRKVMDGGKDMDNYFSVKRVSRDLNDPVTKYIISLSK
eukprot:TRINITY_DN6291_c0_g1_i1.p1 TRINITY_DN6291_c0_g1~~TRINITY_DN6291_c0_g1_i1.p1  ORF type:complete len:365 (-),score=65.63 TRINITY_DN6291_c0_g1_i1:44-1072(-)